MNKQSSRSTLSTRSQRSLTRKSSSCSTVTSNADGTISISKTINSMLSVASNRTCADCRCQMVDTSHIFCSFYAPDKHRLANQRGTVADFKVQHEAYAPPSAKKIVKAKPKQQTPTDPAAFVTANIGGHAVFICQSCAKAHQKMRNCKVQALNDTSVWNVDQVKYVVSKGGNLASWEIYEAFLTPEWQKRRPNSKSSLEQRLAFVRAKYEALAFITPVGGNVAIGAWRKILSKDLSFNRWFQPGLRSYEVLSCGVSTPNKAESASTAIELPKRLVDFFMVVGHENKLVSSQEGHLSNIDSPESLSLKPKIIDCFPSKNTYSDMDYPEHITRFVLPDGCRPSQKQEPATFFTFVLTMGNGSRLYCGALRIYDEVMETADLQTILEASGYTGELPWWLKHGSLQENKPSDLVYLPKCILLVSHYPFFDVMRFFLVRLYRVALAEAPLPIERYLANFMLEVPLPPQGRVEVTFGFTNLTRATISRPPPNELPLVNFSFRPLFQCLSVANILVTVGCLLHETRVVLCSRFTSMLTPCTEALLSMLFPLEWQGMYIPVMPYDMLELLEAPVPFILGVHSKYLSQVEAKNRPHGVVFVDLDKDQVHLGFRDMVPNGGVYQIHTPQLPERDAVKLRSKLDEFGDPAYLLPTNGIKGLITIDNGTLLQSTARDAYARMDTFTPNGSIKNIRMKILAESEKAFADSEMSTLDEFVSEQGHLSERVDAEAVDVPKARTRKFPRMLKRFSANPAGRNRVKRGNTSSEDGFNQKEIRMAFLRFFVSILNRYEIFIVPKKKGFRFQKEAFLDDLNYSPAKRSFMSKVVDTQMFQRFLEERHEQPDDAEIQFFDESITAKNNRSMKISFTTGKQETPFLNDKSWKVKDTFTPPAPSNWGLPDDGRTYHYSRFPKLDKNQFGKPRLVKQWPAEWGTVANRRVAKRSNIRQQSELIGHAMQTIEQVPTLLSNSVRSSTRNIDWAINTLSMALVASSTPRDLSKRDNSTSPISSTVTDKSKDNRATAEEVLLASRRKQGVLIHQIIKIQAGYRMYAERRRYLRYKEAIKLVPSFDEDETHLDRIDKAVSCVLMLQKIVRAFITRRRMARFLDAVVKLQAVTRGKAARIQWHRVKSSVLVQRWWRGTYTRYLVDLLKDSVLRLQAHSRGRRTRLAYDLLMEAVRKLQAVARGCIVRRKIKILVQSQITQYRSQIAILWDRTATPLCYRTRFWIFSGGRGFICHRMLVDEMKRLWSELKIKISQHEALFVDDETLQQAKSVGLATRDEWQSLEVQQMIETKKSSPPTQPWFPGENSPIIRAARSRLVAERAQFYEKLDGLSDTRTLRRIYDLFRIALSEKKKKTRLVDRLWSISDGPEISAEASLLLFPELSKVTNILSGSASNKAKKRYTPAVELVPLQPSQCLEYKLQNLISSNMLAVAMAGLGAVPGLAVKMHEHDTEQEKENHSRQMQAIADTSGERWSRCRLNLLMAYFHQDFEARERRKKKPVEQPKAKSKSIFPDIDASSRNTPQSVFPDIL